MSEIFKWFQCGSMVVVALILGRWFDLERKKSEVQGKPWYTAWLSTPGIMIIIIISGFIIIKKVFP